MFRGVGIGVLVLLGGCTFPKRIDQLQYWELPAHTFGDVACIEINAPKPSRRDVSADLEFSLEQAVRQWARDRLVPISGQSKRLKITIDQACLQETRKPVPSLGLSLPYEDQWDARLSVRFEIQPLSVSKTEMSFVVTTRYSDIVPKDLNFYERQAFWQKCLAKILVDFDQEVAKLWSQCGESL